MSEYNHPTNGGGSATGQSATPHPNPLPDRGGEGASRSGEGHDELPQPNPFRARTWNLTQQARLLKREPQKAARLHAEAVAEGEHHAPWVNRTTFYRPQGF